MESQAFKLEAVPHTELTFSFPRQPRRKQDTTEEQPVAKDVSNVELAQQAVEALQNSTPSFPAGLRSMPPELQGMVWTEKLEKPGLHFLAVHVPLRDGPGQIELTEPTHKIEEIDWPYPSYFPKGMTSAYERWYQLGQTFPFARDAIWHGLVEPLTIMTHNGFDISIDAATDLLYLKFHRQPDGRWFKLSHYVQVPVYWSLMLDHSVFEGIRHIALEMNTYDYCLFWPNGNDNTCGVCGEHRNLHEEDLSTEIWMIADFLHCFPDLESVYLVFADIKQGPVDYARDLRYTVSGRPVVHGSELKPLRWESSPDTPFRAVGGWVRELRGNHILLTLAHVVETLHAYYCFHQKTTINQCSASSSRPPEERMTVKFKFATYGRDDTCGRD